MNRLASLRANVSFFKEEGEKLMPEYEMIFLVGQYAYGMNNQGEITRSTTISDVRFKTGKAGLRSIIDLCQELIEKEEKSLNR